MEAEHHTNPQIMRTNIIHPGADELTYEIRSIVEFAALLQKAGRPIVWENIGDPVAKGERLPAWMKDLISKIMKEDDTIWAYSPTEGLLATREFIAKERNVECGTHLRPDDILFFNGLGDAIATVYTYLHRSARVLGPSPAYPTHSSAEAAHSSSPHLTYLLDPKKNWLPDIEDLRNKVRYNPSIAGILIINPDNPTGMIYPRRILEEIVRIAKEYDLFLVCDEIYAHLDHGPDKMTPLASLIGDVPAIVMRGLSKEIPWPGARSGWIEVYNKDKDPMFARYARTLLDAKRLEVCATTLPQRVFPDIVKDPRFTTYVEERKTHYGNRAEEAARVFRGTPGIMAPKPSGAFYYTVAFDDLPADGKLPIDNPSVRTLVEKRVAGLLPHEADKRFVYYLMGATGVCVVPLSGFNSRQPGFRMTLLEKDDATFTKTLRVIADGIRQYRQN